MNRRTAAPLTRLAYALLVACLALATAMPSPATDREVPFLAGRVNDLAGLLSEAAEGRIERRLVEVEEGTGAQVAVLTVPSLEGDPIEDFSMRVVETWKLGQAERDNGVLFLIARDERRMRIEVGYGLEAVIPDILAGRIQNDIVRPRFQGGDFDGGIEAGVEAIAGLAEGDPEAVPNEQPRRSRSRGIPFWLVVMILFIVLSNLGGRGGRRRGRVRSGPFIPMGGGFGRRGGGFGGGFSGGGGGFGGGGASGSW